MARLKLLYMNKKNVLISACLMGVNCRYDGHSVLAEHLEEIMEQYHLVPVCPEVFGGLPIPREPGERIGDKIITITGKDVTEYYVRGAREVLRLAGLYRCNYAILKERSPSCGNGKIYDGTFSHRLVDGNGVLAELLIKDGITVLGESEISNFISSTLKKG